MFDFTTALRPDLPAPANPWNGFPSYNFVGGHVAGETVPVTALREAADTVLAREGASLATYGLNSGPLGYRPLREFVAKALKARAGIDCDADEILMTGGSLQALDLVNQALLQPGDTVIVEEATYGGALTRLSRLGVSWIGTPLDDDGIRPDSLAKILESGVTPKFIYTIPTVQNPTGSVMSEGRRREILALAKQHQVPIFEDDCYADLIMDVARPPAFHALDEDGMVVYCGSFSKSIAPALRVGYLVARWDLMRRILPLKTDAGSGALEQMVLAEFAGGRFDAHVDAVVSALREKRDAIVDAVAAEFGTSADLTVPKGGIFVWLTLPDDVDTSKLAAAAGAEGVAINPGAEWVAEPDWGRNKLRLCFGNPDVATIREGVAKLADICHREFGVPVRGANVQR